MNYDEHQRREPERVIEGRDGRGQTMNCPRFRKRRGARDQKCFARRSSRAIENHHRCSSGQVYHFR